MKLTKSLFMLCAAGLSLCACNSDDIKDQLPEGYGAVEVKIVPPQTRAETAPDELNGNTVEVTGDVYVTVVHKGGEEWTQKVSASVGQQTVKFYGVTNPTKVKVSMNGGDESYTFDELVAAQSTVTYNLKDAFGQDLNPATETETFDLQAVKTIPVYGETTPTLTSTMEQPAGQPNNGTKQYQMYTATVNLKIPVARLEVSIKRSAASELFETLNVAGAYLDNLYSLDGVTYSNGNYPNITPSTVGNYYFDQSYTTGGHTSKGTAVSPLKKTFSQVVAFTENEASTDVVGFNIFGTAAASVPHFKFVFTNAEAKDGKDAVPTVMYAKITSYKEVGGNDPIALNNGEIYQIIDLAIDDENIGVMEDKGDNLEFGLTATVVKANWTIKPVVGNWEDN